MAVSFITLNCTDGQQLNKQYDHNDFQVDVPDSIGVKSFLLHYSPKTRGSAR
jgi:hypothetical protein